MSDYEYDHGFPTPGWFNIQTMESLLENKATDFPEMNKAAEVITDNLKREIDEAKDPSKVVLAGVS